MTDTSDIRETTQADWPLLQQLYPAAFPEEDLLPLVAQLLEDRTNVLSLAAWFDDSLVGHIALTRCGIEGTNARTALLGPLCAAPDRQSQGIGKTLIQDGLQRLRVEGIVRVMVLGDPAYYGRFGFTADGSIEPPYALPEEWLAAWQSVALTNTPPLSGRLTVPAAWQQPALWLP